MAGITLIGDYTSLRALHRVVHDINTRSPLIPEAQKDGIFISLAYETRKAYERQREIIEAPATYEEMGIRYGFKTLWPVILLQHRFLRASLGYFDHGPEHQAMAYALEAVLNDAIREAFKGQADTVIRRWQELDPQSPNVFDKVHSRGALFCAWSRTERQKLLASLLLSFHRHYDEASFRLARKADFVSPAEFIQWEVLEWPDPRW
ncbi:DUF6904 family protein [Asticcacaulis sp. W401b]|uniref:DUF6904 family protein n=1 Tax=Asticcacaulis sp. W401b TaxID=3388666 RepID=UPI003970536F